MAGPVRCEQAFFECHTSVQLLLEKRLGSCEVYLYTCADDLLSIKPYKYGLFDHILMVALTIWLYKEELSYAVCAH